MAAATQGLAGQQVVVIGGSSGIGLAAGIGAVQRGADVTLVARNAERLAAAAAQIRAARADASVRVSVADVSDAARLREVLAVHETVDHVLLTAGTAALSDLIAGPPLEEQLLPLQQRVGSAVVAVRTLASRIRPGGSFVFTGGLSTARPVKGAWVTGIATAAAEQLASVLAVELAPIRFNAISPGWVDTPMWDPILGAAKADVFADVAGRTPIGRLVTAEEAADAALFLMSNAAMTGAVVHVDGGQRFT